MALQIISSYFKPKGRLSRNIVGFHIASSSFNLNRRFSTCQRFFETVRFSTLLRQYRGLSKNTVAFQATSSLFKLHCRFSDYIVALENAFLAFLDMPSLFSLYRRCSSYFVVLKLYRRFSICIFAFQAKRRSSKYIVVVQAISPVFKLHRPYSLFILS